MVVSRDRTCPICNNVAQYRLTKGVTQYFQCTNCKTLFCDELDNDNMVGGEHEVGRNELQNHLRVARVGEMLLGYKKEDVSILDFGAGHGFLVKDLKAAGYPNVSGYDAYYEHFSRLPEKNKYHVITMIECIEHLAAPYVEIDVIFRSLVNGGCLMVETSFVDIAWQENIELEDFFYIAPQNGHSTIFSHHGIDVLMLKKGLTPIQHFNRHVRVFQKIVK